MAWANDRLVDLAILTNEFAQTPELQDVLLEAALGHAPHGRLRARLQVIGLLTRLSYGCIVLGSFASASAMAQDRSLAAFSPSEFRAAVADGRLKSGSPETAYAFGKMSLAAFISGIDAPGFDEVLARVEQG